MKKPQNKLQVKVTPIFRFSQQEEAGSRKMPTDPTITITITGEVSFDGEQRKK